MKFLINVFFLLSVALLVACSGTKAPEQSASITLEVYKSPTCGCCGSWVKHNETSGFTSAVTDLDSVDAVKNTLGIPQRMRSCHTGVYSGENDNKYFFEGHVPAKYISAFLKNPPLNAIGLAVPGMPTGSPGMEMVDSFTPYAIMLIKKDGSAEVYAKLKTYEEQF